MHPNPLLQLHQTANAETADYGELELVTTFGQPQAEYAAIHKGCGLLDMPFKAAIEVTGKDRHAFLNNQLTNALIDRERKQPLSPGLGVYSFYLNLKGRIVADMVVTELGDRIMMVVDARLAAPLVETLERYVFTEKITFTLRPDLHVIGAFGPAAPLIVANLVDTDFAMPVPFGGANVRAMGADVTVIRQDLTPSTGLLMLTPTDRVADVWQHVVNTNAAAELGERRTRPVGWAAFNAARVELGRAWLGIDYEPAPPSRPGEKASPEDDAKPAARGVLPAETGVFDLAVSVTKGCYLGQEVVARMHARKVVARKIVGLKMSADALPMAGTEIFDADQKPIGVLTSSTISPRLSNACLAMALLKRPHFELGTTVRVPAEGAIHDAVVVETPFVRSEV